MRVEIPASWFVVIWYRSAEIEKTEMLQIHFNTRIISMSIFTLTPRNTTHVIYISRFPLPLPACLGLRISVQSSVIKGGQSHPELSEDVAKADNIL